MSAELAIVKVPEQGPDLAAVERVIVTGDLSKLSPDERWNYYKGVCQSVGLNPFTQPFLYITLSGKLVLYATKGAADQLRDNHHISISQPKVDLSDGLCIVTVTASDRTGRTDSDLGIVPIENLRGDAKANAILKAVTKAKRRVTLSMCGLGMLDETEVETIPNARPANIPVLPTPTDTTTEPIGEYPNLDAALDKARTQKVEASAVLTGAEVSRRKKLGDKLRAGTAAARELGADVEELDPDTLSDAELLGTVQALGEMVQSIKAEMAKQAAPAEDDDEAF